MALMQIFAVSLGFDYKSPQLVETLAEVTKARTAFYGYPIAGYFKRTVPAGEDALVRGVAFDNVGFGLTLEAAISGLEQSLQAEVADLEKMTNRIRARAELVQSLRQQKTAVHAAEKLRELLSSRRNP